MLARLRKWLAGFNVSRFCSFCVGVTGAAFIYTLYTIKDLRDDDTLCVCIFLLPVLLMSAVAAKLLTTRRSNVRALLYRTTGLKLFAVRDYKRRSDILTENYIQELNDGSLLALVILLMVAASAIWMRDTEILILSTAIAFLLFLHTAVTEYRVSRGYFGAIGAEALELISFIASKARRGEPPPGSKFARQFDDRDLTDIKNMDHVGARI